MSRTRSLLKCVLDQSTHSFNRVMGELLDKSSHILDAYTISSSALSRLCVSKRTPCEGLSCMRRSCVARQTPVRFVGHLRLGMLNDLYRQNTSLEIDSAQSSWNGGALSTSSDPLSYIHCMIDFPSLHRFLQRVGRHPTLQRSTLLRAFFESTEWVTIVSKLLLSNYADSQNYSTSTCTSTLHTPQDPNPRRESWIIFPTRF
jgi:hypothetical protein